MLTSTSNSVSWVKKHSFTSKWNILFDKSPEWIAFKPQLGQKVYPCYSCKNMFASKATFQDHINRRVIIIKYKCVFCANTLTFYNRCSFLLHTRKHYSLLEGTVNLANVDILVLPIDLAGFSRDHSVPFLYDEEEEFVDCESVHINSQFYHPNDSEAGKQIINLKPFNLVFHYRQNETDIVMVLKQITSNIPLCEFVKKELKPRMIKPKVPNLIPLESTVKQEPMSDDSDFTIPVISKVETINANLPPICSECKIPQQKLISHFAGINRPADETLICSVCKYVAATNCSLQAHIRTHENIPPFVCPECGELFDDCDKLHQHIDDVCFHFCKQIRFRCPAQKCGKHFVLPNKYHVHFATHFQTLNKCSACNLSEMTDTEFIQHGQTHMKCVAVKVFKCTVCKSMPVFERDKYSEHVTWHTKNREQCVYIYTCKFCKSYFRSRDTYDMHRQRCPKNDLATRIAFPPITIQCHFCNQKIVLRESQKTCTICKQINHYPNTKSLDKPEMCMLCKEEITEENRVHHTKQCKYNNPVVTIKALNSDKDSDDAISEKLSSTNSDVESKTTLDTSSDSQRTDETPGVSKKKLKRKSTPASSLKSKKPALDESVDMQADEPVSFDGTYYCKLCDFKNIDRDKFHKHIVEHRDISTAYQCMECGECFVVKPSLVKHLLHYHKINDTNAYLSKNECCDKTAIEELETHLKLGTAERKGPIKENQCTVCLQQFEDSLSLNKHFRIHGMAFLMKATK